MSKFSKLLESCNITQKEIVNELGVSKQLVSFWARGRAIPRLPEVVKLSEILNVSIEEVVMCFVEESR